MYYYVLWVFTCRGSFFNFVLEIILNWIIFNVLFEKELKLNHENHEKEKKDNENLFERKDNGDEIVNI